jgi:imidazoleglycerol-phosphate dehydratase
MSTLVRETRETSVRISLDIPTGEAPSEVPSIATGDAFFDHMLTAFARYSGLAMEVAATGDMRHHLIEDVAITLGLALKEIVPPTCQRYGDRIVVMDDAMVQAALDLGGRAWYEGPLPSSLYDHFMRSFAENAALTLHIRVLRGQDRHHVIEAAVKALGFALRAALAPGSAVFSTKGAVRVERPREA